MDIATVNSETMSRESEAALLHYEILKNGADAAEAMCSLALNLKRMRDERLFIELGYDSFENYTEQAVGLKKSQAYDYIKALESLGEDVFRSSGKFGITKVKALCAFTPSEAENFINENDVDSLTVKELKAKIKELTKKGEQLTLDLSEAGSRTDEYSRKIDELNSEKTELQKYIKELENKPIDVAVRELTEDEKSALIADAVSTATADLKNRLEDTKKKLSDANKAQSDEKKRHEKELADAKEAAEEKAASKNRELTAEVEKAKAKASELEKQLKISGNPEITKVSFYFESVRNDMKSIIEALKKIEDVTTVEKLQANFKNYLERIIAAL